MKKVFNSVGVVLAVLTTIIATLVITSYAIVFTVQNLISEKTLEKFVMDIDVVEQFKKVDDGELWAKMIDKAETEVSLSEKQVTKLLNNDSIKEEVINYLDKIATGIKEKEKVTISKEELSVSIGVAVREYNKVSDNKITESQKEQIIDIISDEILDDINKQLKELDTENLLDEELKYDEIDSVFTDYGIFSALLVIAGLYLLVAIFRLSTYKWMSYAGVSNLIPAILLLISGAVLTLIDISRIEYGDMITIVKDIVANNLLLTSGILFGISIFFFILHNRTKKSVAKKKEAKQNAVVQVPVEQNVTSAQEEVKALEEPKQEVPVEEPKEEKEEVEPVVKEESQELPENESKEEKVEEPEPTKEENEKEEPVVEDKKEGSEVKEEKKEESKKEKTTPEKKETKEKNSTPKKSSSKKKPTKKTQSTNKKTTKKEAK